MLEICRLWGQPPSWWGERTPDEQVDLWAWWQIYTAPPKKQPQRPGPRRKGR